MVSKRRRGKRVVRGQRKVRRQWARVSINMTRKMAMMMRMEDPEHTAPPQMCFTMEP